VVPPDAPLLTWKQHDKYALVSDCGRYSVAKIGSATGRYTYEAWKRGQYPALAVNLPDANTAKLRCEHDQDTTPL
jgi:hypothetical protein